MADKEDNQNSTDPEAQGEVVGKVAPIRVTEVEAGIDVREMGASDRAKFWLAKVVLLASAVLMTFAWLIYIVFAIWGMPGTPVPCTVGDGQDLAVCTQLVQIHSDQLEAAKSIFEFAKSWIPPIITLVLGYYFAKEDKNSN